MNRLGPDPARFASPWGGLLAFCLLAGLVRCQGQGGEVPPTPEAKVEQPAKTGAARPPAADPASPADGKQLYQERCSNCHSLDHLDVGPAMLYIAKKYAGRPEALAAYLKNPEKVDPKLPTMPAVNLPEGDLRAVANYALKLPVRAADTLAPPSTRPEPLPPPPAAPASEGEAVFAAWCTSCHALDTAKIGPPLRPLLEKYRGRPQALLEYLKNPVRVDEEYPAMAPLSLSERDLQAAADYLLSLLTSDSREDQP